MEGKDQDTEDNRIINRKLSEYNSIIKENEGIYHKVAKKNGLSNGAFWILYMMCEEEGNLTQSAVCDAFYQPKQTVNSAIKKLEKEGFVELETVAVMENILILHRRAGNLQKIQFSKLLQVSRKPLMVYP